MTQKLKSIKMCGVQVHYPYEPYPQQVNITQTVILSCSRLQNGAVEVPTGCGKTMALLCSSLGFVVDQRYKLLELMSSDDSLWQKVAVPIEPKVDPDISVVYESLESKSEFPTPSTVDAVISSVVAGTAEKAPCQSSTPDRVYSDVTPIRSRLAQLRSLVIEDDDDFKPLVVKQPKKKARKDTCGSPCLMGCAGDSYMHGSADSSTSAAGLCSDTAWDPYRCSIVDIEDTTIPSANNKPQVSAKDKFQKFTFEPEKRGGDLEVGFQASTPRSRSPEIFDISDDSTVTSSLYSAITSFVGTPRKSSNDTPIRYPMDPPKNSVAGQTIGGIPAVNVTMDSLTDCAVSSTISSAAYTAQEESSQTWSEFSTQEFLSQSYYDAELGIEVQTGVDMNVTRDAVRATLGRRTREPVQGGEFGPTRSFLRGPVRVPKIFYCSRTHLQLDQVANEIKRTPYCDARVVVLSSREHTCINHREFQRGKWLSRTEMCHDLLDPSEAHSEKNMGSPSKTSCFFYRNSKQYDSHGQMESIGVGPVVDINSLIRAGRRHKFCPYFAARNIVQTADIVLCPVNYLIDPLVRKSMQINLKGEIIIIDEAHMLEEMCREIASLVISIKDIKECYQDCCNLVQRQELVEPHMAMANFLKTLQTWIETNSENAFSSGYGREREFSLPSCQLIASLEQSELNKESLGTFSKGFAEAAKHREELMAEERSSITYLKVITSKTEQICERMVLIMNLVFEHPEDYVGSVSLVDQFETGSARSRGEVEWCLKLVCQNPAIIFRSLSSITRSIIFSSATLHPMTAFAAELGVEIQNRVIKGHVIPPDQTWIGCLPSGKNGKQLYGVFNIAKTDEYMDEVGEVVLDVCQRVPYGCLVFVASYRALEKFVQRWKDTGLWTRISEHKRPYLELRRANDFNKVLEDFYDDVKHAQEALLSGLVSLGTGCTGPLLIAVMRGKVSEGFNFADDKTRAILTVGIPYPNIYEDSVKWKREYNNSNVSRKIQNAEGWYNTQAFRALSQSLGRGLRHRHDWCVLLLLESRLQNPKYLQCLPEWMYQRINFFNKQYSSMLIGIENFIKKMNREPEIDNI